MTNAKIDLMAPEWQMEDAYGNIRSPRYEASVADALEAVKNLETDSIVTRENVAERLALYDRAVTLLSSLASFVKCTGAKDGTDERVPAENARLAEIAARRDRAANTLFAFLEELPSEDPLWKTSPLSDWAFVVSERRSDWKKSLTEAERDWLASWKTRCFTPLGDLFKTLQQQGSISCDQFVHYSTPPTPMSCRAATLLGAASTSAATPYSAKRPDSITAT